MFKPVTEWAENIYTSNEILEIVNKTFNQALGGNFRPGSAYIGSPQDIEAQKAPVRSGGSDRFQDSKAKSEPNRTAIYNAAQLIKRAKHPIILVGMGVIREHASTKVRVL